MFSGHTEGRPKAIKTLQQIEARRKTLAEELLGIRCLRKGSVNEQWFAVVRDGKKTKDLRGPYYVHSYKVGNKSVSERLNDEEAVKQARAEATNYRRFKELCEEFEALTQRLGELERGLDSTLETLKKKPSSPSSKTKK